MAEQRGERFTNGIQKYGKSMSTPFAASTSRGNGRDVNKLEYFKVTAFDIHDQDGALNGTAASYGGGNSVSRFNNTSGTIASQNSITGEEGRLLLLLRRCKNWLLRWSSRVT